MGGFILQGEIFCKIVVDRIHFRLGDFGKQGRGKIIYQIIEFVVESCNFVIDILLAMGTFDLKIAAVLHRVQQIK
jgi:hypothetical protein